MFLLVLVLLSISVISADWVEVPVNRPNTQTCDSFCQINPITAESCSENQCSDVTAIGGYATPETFYGGEFLMTAEDDKIHAICSYQFGNYYEGDKLYCCCSSAEPPIETCINNDCKFQNKLDQTCLSVENSLTDNGENILQELCVEENNQLWNLIKVGDYYEIVVKHSGKCLDVSDESQLNGANIHQWTCTEDNNQLWTINKRLGVNEGFYQLKAKHSGKCLDVSTNGNVQQLTCSEADNQLWKFTDTITSGDGTPDTNGDTPCGADTECDQGFICNDEGFCEDNGCTNNDDCELGFLCDTNTRNCFPSNEEDCYQFGDPYREKCCVNEIPYKDPLCDEYCGDCNYNEVCCTTDTPLYQPVTICKIENECTGPYNKILECPNLDKYEEPGQILYSSTSHSEQFCNGYAWHDGKDFVGKIFWGSNTYEIVANEEGKYNICLGEQRTKDSIGGIEFRQNQIVNIYNEDYLCYFDGIKNRIYECCGSYECANEDGKSAGESAGGHVCSVRGEWIYSPGTACTSDSNCEGLNTCIDGSCQFIECTYSNVCPTGYECYNNEYCLNEDRCIDFDEGEICCDDLTDNEIKSLEGIQFVCNNGVWRSAAENFGEIFYVNQGYDKYDLVSDGTGYHYCDANSEQSNTIAQIVDYTNPLFGITDFNNHYLCTEDYLVDTTYERFYECCGDDSSNCISTLIGRQKVTNQLYNYDNVLCKSEGEWSICTSDKEGETNEDFYCNEDYWIPKEKICNDNLDNNEIQGTDCQDVTCKEEECGIGEFPEGAICEEFSCVEKSCNDEIDNDNDEIIKCTGDNVNQLFCSGVLEIGCLDYPELCSGSYVICSDYDVNYGSHGVCTIPEGGYCEGNSDCAYLSCVENTCWNREVCEESLDRDYCNCVIQELGGGINLTEARKSCNVEQKMVCENDNQCLTGELCLNNECVQKRGTDCADSDCIGEISINNHQCCFLDEDCPTGTECQNNECHETNCDKDSPDEDGDGLDNCADSDCLNQFCSGSGISRRVCTEEGTCRGLPTAPTAPSPQDIIREIKLAYSYDDFLNTLNECSVITNPDTSCKVACENRNMACAFAEGGENTCEETDSTKCTCC